MKRKTFFLMLFCLILPLSAWGKVSVPVKDLKNSHDPSFLKRFDQSVIVAYKHSKFTQFTFPLSPLKPTGKSRNDIDFYAPEKSISPQGEYTRIAYLIPKGHSPLEVIGNYELFTKEIGGKILFRCETDECGGNPNHASWIWYGDISLAYYLEDMKSVRSYNDQSSAGYCALSSPSIENQQFMVAQLPDGKGIFSVLTYSLGESAGCELFQGRTVAVVDVLQKKQMKDKMVFVNAEEMASSIAKNGSISLYGIYFDTGKAVIKEKSMPTIEQIAVLLRNKPSLRLLVVGHTDTQGTFSYNMALSEQRAKAVVHVLVSKYAISAKRLKPVGVGFSCPRASNRTEQGRAKNRRVELVEY